MVRARLVRLLALCGTGLGAGTGLDLLENVQPLHDVSMKLPTLVEGTMHLLTQHIRGY